MGDIFSSINNGLLARGFSVDQAQGITAGVYAEGGVSANGIYNTNPTSGAYGLGQWLGARKQGLFAAFGSSPTFDQQLDYLTMELRGGDPGGKTVLAQSGASNVFTKYITAFMRPGAGTTGDLTRGNQYLANNGAGINKTIGDSLASFSPSLGAASNALGEALAAPGNALGAATDKLLGGLDPSQWFQRIALAILAILLIGIALSMLAGKPVAAIASKLPPVVPV